IALMRVATTNRLAVVGATGGRDWVQDSVPFVFAVDAQKHLTGNTGPGTVLWTRALSTNESVYAAPTIAGNDVYLVTSFGDLGGSLGVLAGEAGNVRRINLGTGTISFTSAVKQGGGEAAVGPDGTLTVASTTGESKFGNGD